MTRTLIASVLASSLMLSGAASAAGPVYDRGASQYEWADVVNVEPIYSSYDRPVADRHCYEQPVTYREPVRYYDGRRDRAPAVLGAIVGGVVGNQFGKGHGRDAATAAGALLGYHAVRDSQRHYGGYYAGGREYTRYENRCTVRTDYVREEVINGYDVTYRYRGQIYRTTTDYDPGDRIQVAVDVRPVR